MKGYGDLKVETEKTLYKKNLEKTKDLINTYKKRDLIFGFSGGRDSSVLVDIAIDVLGKENVNVVFHDTKIEFKETYDFVEEMIEYWGIPDSNFYETEPVRSFFKELGYCDNQLHLLAKIRGCCYALKKIPLDNLMEEEGFDVAVNGVRREESRQRHNYEDYFIKFEDTKVDYYLLQPLLDWKRDQIDRYIEENELPENPIYDMGYKSCGCAICPCPNKAYDYYSILKKNHPKWYNVIKRFAKKEHIYYHKWEDNN